jgi:16S rRNA (guanine966-N2)-methyltransferase
VIGGEFRGRRLLAPVTPSVRPTSDRAREAIFDMLFSLGGVDGLQVADLFSGTGALGIEALSRGAASVTFVDRDPASLDLVRQNLASVGLPDAERDGYATIVRADVDAWVASTLSRYDLVLCDPPYDYDGWENLIRRLPGDLAVLESGAELPAVDGWGVLKFKRYGGTIVTVARPEPVSQKGAS